MDDQALPNRLRTPALALLVCYWVALGLGTHWPRAHEVLHIGTSDKALHFSAYLGLALLVGVNWTLRGRFGWRQRAIALVAVAAFGVLDELTQIPVGRDASIYDWLADCLGAVAGLAVCVGLTAGVRGWREEV
jgi:VanZ family protein